MSVETPKCPGDLRPAVLAFAYAMETKLRVNDHKGGWARCSNGYLLRRLRNETKELASALHRQNRSRKDWNSHAPLILAEAADVANFAMMIADVCGNLGEPLEAAVPSWNGARVEDA